MAELLYASAHLTGDFPNPDSAVGNTPGTWAGDLNSNTSYTSRWAMGDPVDPLTDAATQTVRVTARKGSNVGDPTVTVNLYDGGVLVSQLASATVTSTTGQTLVGTFNTADVSAGANVEVEVVQTAVGGKPSDRNSAQISHIEWTADTTAQAAPVPEVVGPLTVAVDLSGALNVPTASVGSVSAPLTVEVSAGGVAAAPAAQVGSVSSVLPVAVDLSGALNVPAASTPQVAAPLTVEIDAAGVLSVPAATVAELAGSLTVEPDLGGVVGAPTVGVPEVSGGLAVAVGSVGVLDAPTATVPELVGALALVVDVSGTVTGPAGDPSAAAKKLLDREMAWPLIPNANRSLS